ncbi:hypothetical protein K8375_05890 [Weissella cibaria]|uniref:hypothetical protein n=1 Tax=Weissella cibaria TaxID=137591 RepID=UPI001CC7A9BC|nr:hypothetical protein [Weissella cibaria]MBZ6069632.1 hypothetical protein [Weissella cibaria]
MATITYRQATMADADAIWQIIADAKAVMSIDQNPQWDNGYPSQKLSKQISQKVMRMCYYLAMKLSQPQPYGKKRM